LNIKHYFHIKAFNKQHDSFLKNFNLFLGNIWGVSLSGRALRCNLFLPKYKGKKRIFASIPNAWQQHAACLFIPQIKKIYPPFFYNALISIYLIITA